MPIINVKLSGKNDSKKAQLVAERLWNLTGRILKKKPEVTAITVSFVEPECWFIAGKSLREHNKASFYFDIKITDETNTKDEKSTYISECFSAMRELLGPLHEESYIYVQDVRAAAYGFGGFTQEYRYQHS